MQCTQSFRLFGVNQYSINRINCYLTHILVLLLDQDCFLQIYQLLCIYIILYKVAYRRIYGSGYFDYTRRDPFSRKAFPRTPCTDTWSFLCFSKSLGAWSKHTQSSTNAKDLKDLPGFL